MLLKVLLNLWHLRHCGRKTSLVSRRSLSVGKIEPLQMEKKKSKYLWWILETGEYGGVSLGNQRILALKEKKGSPQTDVFIHLGLCRPGS